jgi:hypothetical protein
MVESWCSSVGLVLSPVRPGRTTWGPNRYIEKRAGKRSKIPGAAAGILEISWPSVLRGRRRTLSARPFSSFRPAKAWRTHLGGARGFTFADVRGLMPNCVRGWSASHFLQFIYISKSSLGSLVAPTFVFKENQQCCAAFPFVVGAG